LIRRANKARGSFIYDFGFMTNVQGKKVPVCYLYLTAMQWSDDATPAPDHPAVHATVIVIGLEAAIDNKTEPEGLLLSPWS
jgi:hypothetical protein